MTADFTVSVGSGACKQGYHVLRQSNRLSVFYKGTCNEFIFSKKVRKLYLKYLFELKVSVAV